MSQSYNTGYTLGQSGAGQNPDENRAALKHMRKREARVGSEDGLVARRPPLSQRIKKRFRRS